MTDGEQRPDWLDQDTSTHEDVRKTLQTEINEEAAKRKTQEMAAGRQSFADYAKDKGLSPRTVQALSIRVAEAGTPAAQANWDKLINDWLASPEGQAHKKAQSYQTEKNPRTKY